MLTEPEVDFEAAGEVVPIRPESLERADRFGRRLLKVRQEAAEIKAAAAAERDRIRVWEELRLAAVHKQAAFFEQSLEMFSRAIAERTGAKSAPLPCGLTLTLRAPGAGETVVVDEATFLAWAFTCANCGHRHEGPDPCAAPVPDAGRLEGLCHCDDLAYQGSGLYRQPQAPPPAPALVELKKLRHVDSQTDGAFVVSQLATTDGEKVPGVFHRVAAVDKFDIK
jgi:hypothetical protein